MKRGLKLGTPNQVIYDKDHRPNPGPDEEGIETTAPRQNQHRHLRPNPGPDEEGIETNTPSTLSDCFLMSEPRPR